MLLSDLAKVIVSKPDIIQFAKDRKYEEAWIIPLKVGRPTEQEISAYLNKDQYELMIVEYIWNSEIDDKRFVLTVFFDSNCELQDHKIFINLCLDMFFNYDNFISFVELFDQKIIGRAYLFRSLAEVCNMSIFNHWLSVGPVDLWQKGELYDRENIKQKISSRPEIETSRLNYQGLLFRFNISLKENGPIYGLKTPCCKKDKDKWRVDYELVDEWMRKIINL